MTVCDALTAAWLLSVSPAPPGYHPACYATETDCRMAQYGMRDAFRIDRSERQADCVLERHRKERTR